MPRIVPLSEIIHPFLAVTTPKAEALACTRCQEMAFTPPYSVWDKDPEAGLCLYHSEREDKAEEFKKAIDAMVKAGNCNFRGFVFSPGFSFRARPLKGAVFARATFQGDANFVRASFHLYANFVQAAFQGDALFSQAAFQGDADFSEASFQRNTSFSRATFQEDANFYGATFKGNAFFFAGVFQRNAGFFGATFKQKANFSFARLSERTDATTDFSQARFEGAADFRGGWLKEDDKEIEYELFSKEHDTQFLRVSFERPELVYFYRVNLSRCRFLDTDLKSVNFIGITQWHKKGWANALFDEDHPDSKERFPELTELYRQLKQNYEDRRNWEMANHFHYGQMEMRWRQGWIAQFLEKRKEIRNKNEEEKPLTERVKRDAKILREKWENRMEGPALSGWLLSSMYRVLSGYGVRFDWTLLWLFFLALLFAAVYTYWLNGSIGQGLKHAVRLMTLIPREAAQEFKAPWWLTTLNSLTGASLIALLVLALRRRFRF